MASESLNYTFAFNLSIPDLNSPICRACDYENLIEYVFCQQAFYFPLVNVGQVVIFTNLIIFTFCKFL